MSTVRVYNNMVLVVAIVIFLVAMVTAIEEQENLLSMSIALACVQHSTLCNVHCTAEHMKSKTIHDSNVYYVECTLRVYKV